MRLRLVILMIAGLFAMVGDTPGGHISDAVRTHLAAICKHYVNRARFLPRGRDQEFVVTLADGCVEAQVSLNSTTAERLAALDFLKRLRIFRDTVIDMNMTRVFGQDYTAFTRITYGKGAKSEPVRRVSTAGEYLIAYRMGLLKAYRTWLDTSPRFALVSKPGGYP